MSSQQKRGFRLPWAADRSTEDAAGAATLEADSADPTSPAQIEDGEGGELGEGPFHFADAATPDASTDASPETPDVPETAAEAGMLNTDTATTESAEQEAATTSTNDDDTWAALRRKAAQAADAEPETGDDAFEAVTDQAESEPAPAEEPAPKTTSRKSTNAEPDARAPRTNPLVAGLVKAMREAAVSSRAETTTRLQAEATARVEEIRSSGGEEATALRKRVDEDIASIRDWSKGEMARIRQETEARIESRRTDAIAENDAHTARIEKLVAQVQGRVDAYEAEMDRFFEELLAENDPTRLAALAGGAPEPPDLSEVLDLVEETETPTTSEWDDVAWGVTPDMLIGEGDPETTTESDPDAVIGEAAPTTETPAEAETATETESTIETAPGLEAEAAAEAEAASTEGLEIPDNNVWPTSVLAAARRTLHTPATDFEAAGVANTRLLVNGLTSVAGISAFKGALGQLPGVRSVSVSSGEPGVFIFTVVHTPETDLQDGIAGLTAFSARVTEASGESLTVVAQEPAA
jgi:hypothetical protein